jgi:hypothetical protein
LGLPADDQVGGSRGRMIRGFGTGATPQPKISAANQEFRVI